MRVFGSDRISGVMERLGLEEGQDIQHPLITRAITTAQKRVENHNFEIRKWLIKYDDVMNKHREVIYSYRNTILEEHDLKDYLFEHLNEVLSNLCDNYYILEGTDETVDFVGLSKQIFSLIGMIIKPEELEGKSRDELYDDIFSKLEQDYEKKKKSIDEEMFSSYLKWKLLDVVDTKWKDHLYGMDELRESVSLRAFGQKDPLVEYQHEGHRLFLTMMDEIKFTSVREVFAMPIMYVDEELARQDHFEVSDLVHPEFDRHSSFQAEEQSQPQAVPSQTMETYEKDEPYVRTDKKVGRNEPCPCGSGKKYKKCCAK